MLLVYNVLWSKNIKTQHIPFEKNYLKKQQKNLKKGQKI